MHPVSEASGPAPRSPVSEHISPSVLEASAVSSDCQFLHGIIVDSCRCVSHSATHAPLARHLPQPLTCPPSIPRSTDRSLRDRPSSPGRLTIPRLKAADLDSCECDESRETSHLSGTIHSEQERIPLYSPPTNILSSTDYPVQPVLDPRWAGVARRSVVTPRRLLAPFAID